MLLFELMKHTFNQCDAVDFDHTFGIVLRQLFESFAHACRENYGLHYEFLFNSSEIFL